MLGTVLDIFRLRQYFNVATVTRQLAEGIREDATFVDLVRRAMLPLPFDRVRPVDPHPFPPFEQRCLEERQGSRLGVVATGGSGALASVVGVARALEESGIRPAVISVCSGSALYGFPIAAGVPADTVASFVLSLRPEEYVDVDWAKVLALLPTAGRGFGGILRGEAIERRFEDLLGDMTLRDLPVPAYAPIWNIEENRVEYLGPSTHPDVTVVRAMHMAIALPLFFEPVRLGNGYWCDGGIVDIFPVHPVLDIEERCDVVLAVNGFYPSGFAGEDARGWQDRAASILHVASQVRTCQQVELARENLARLERETELLMIDPVPYSKVRGAGFYRQFVDTSEWPDFMRAGRDEALRVLRGAPAPAGETNRGIATAPAP